jgi:hypothetical protein
VDRLGGNCRCKDKIHARWGEKGKKECVRSSYPSNMGARKISFSSFFFGGET